MEPYFIITKGEHKFLRERHYENINDLGVTVLSLANLREIDIQDPEDIQLALEKVRENYSASFFFIMRKFDYFQKGQHYRTKVGIFDKLSKCLLGPENEFLVLEHKQIEKKVTIFERVALIPIFFELQIIFIRDLYYLFIYLFFKT